VFLEFGLVEILTDGAYYMADIQLLIGQSSTEGERKKKERMRLKRQKLLPSGEVDICPPEIRDKRLDIRDKSIENREYENARTYGRYQNVFLSDRELAELQADFPTVWSQYIEKLSEYMASILNRLIGMFSEDRASFIASLDEYDLLIIDDLGVERSTDYVMEQMFFVIDSRYRSRRPMIITTNLKLSELKNPPDLAHARIYDRILERCAPILFAGKNFREENAGATKEAAKDLVNRKPN